NSKVPPIASGLTATFNVSTAPLGNCANATHAVPASAVTDNSAVPSEKVKTTKNFPNTNVTRETGLHNSVSIVPRSFSPAANSIAGYTAPVMQSTTSKYGSNPPNSAPVTFSGGATFLRVTANG